jgi:hypothetical protein
MSKNIVGHTTENVALLPKWAQQKIARLTEEVEHWKSIAHAASTPGETNVVLVDGIDQRGLPPNSHVRFQLSGPRHAIEAGVRAGYDGIEIGCLEGVLVVRPAVSNVIYVEVRDR